MLNRNSFLQFVLPPPTTSIIEDEERGGDSVTNKRNFETWPLHLNVWNNLRGHGSCYCPRTFSFSSHPRINNIMRLILRRSLCNYYFNCHPERKIPLLSFMAFTSRSSLKHIPTELRAKWKSHKDQTGHWSAKDIINHQRSCWKLGMRFKEEL